MKLYFEGYYARPLPNAYYNTTVQTLSQVQAEDFVQAQRETPCPFYRLYSFRRWSPLAIKELALREDRAEYHIPAAMEQISLLRVTPAYLPMYIVEATKQSTSYYMVFTAAQQGRDEFFEKFVNSYAEILLPISNKDKPDSTQIWEAWHKEPANMETEENAEEAKANTEEEAKKMPDLPANVNERTEEEKGEDEENGPLL